MVEMNGSKPDFELPLTTQSIGGQNGRVSFVQAPSAGGRGPPASSAGFAYGMAGDPMAKDDALRGNWEETPVSSAFFSVDNMDYLQREIVRQVYEKSGPDQWVIDPQDIDELKIVMRAMFYQYAKNLPTRVKEQVKELNDLVLAWSVPRVMSEISSHIYYINDISKLPVPLPQPMLMTKAGTKTLEFTHFM